MGYNLKRRISTLQDQAKDTDSGHWGFFKVLLIALASITLFTLFVLPADKLSGSEEASWHDDVQKRFALRYQWLQDSPLVLWGGAAESYQNFAESVYSTFETELPKTEYPEEPHTIDSIYVWFGQTAVAISLRISFLVFAFWPLWILASLIGYFLLRANLFSKKKRETILSVCDRGNGPFYSGIYGPLRPNNSYSGTDFSCPSLACPKMEKANNAARHRITETLRKYKAFNQTTFNLARIVIAHRDFPAFVPEEHGTGSSEDEAQSDGTVRQSQTGFVTAENGTLEQITLEGLAGVLSAHEKLRFYIATLKKKGVSSEKLNANYGGHLGNIKKLTTPLSPLARQLVATLTPTRQWALGQLSPDMIATAYLAIEAGKVLMYRRHEQGFVLISNYPHLQARAVVQSLPEYHNEYNGDQRLSLRHAILCSRRHGDFGRAFLPIHMPVEARALRDWLEILFSEKERRQESAHLVELDAHMEEIGNIWRRVLSKRFEDMDKNASSSDGFEPKGPFQNSWKGLAYKSVVLFPLREVIKTALNGVHPQRIKRISQLLTLTRKHQARISISARLPGFKRQAMEAEKGGEETDKLIQEIRSQKNGAELLDHWRIVRRMLTRYNWLSTRVGDDGVPIIGIVQGIVRPPAETLKNSVVGLDALVPLRQRRFSELFGRRWESAYYADSPATEDVDIYVDSTEFDKALAKASKPARDSESSDPDSQGPADGNIKNANEDNGAAKKVVSM